MIKSIFTCLMVGMSVMFACTQKSKNVADSEISGVIKSYVRLDEIAEPHIFLLISENMCSSCIINEFDYIKNALGENQITVVGLYKNKRHFYSSISYFKNIPTLYLDGKRYDKLPILPNSVTPIYFITNNDGEIIDYLSTSNDRNETTDFLDKYINQAKLFN